MLPASILQELTGRVLVMNEAPDAGVLCQLACEALAALVPCDWPVISLATSQLPTVRFAYSPQAGDWLQYADDSLAGAHEDPVYTARLRLHLDGPASTTSMIRPRDLERTAYHERVWQPLQVKRMVRYLSPGLLSFRVEVARTTDTEFTTGEVELVRAIGRHLDAAAQRLIRQHHGRLPISGTLYPVQSFAWAVCDNQGRILRTTPEAAQRMRECLGAGAALDRIPQHWLAELQSRARGAPGNPFWTVAGGHSMSVHIAPIRPTPDEFSVGFLTQPGAPEPLAALRGLGLTQRQAEVLHWVAQGKSNPEIGVILGTSALTVKKHMEAIFHALGVENRTTAARRAIEAERLAQGPWDRRSPGRSSADRA